MKLQILRRRAEMLDAVSTGSFFEGMGFNQSEIVNELSKKTVSTKPVLVESEMAKKCRRIVKQERRKPC